MTIQHEKIRQDPSDRQSTERPVSLNLPEACDGSSSSTGDRKIRILYSHRIYSRDGQSVHLEELVSAFRAAGSEVLVVGPISYENTDVGEESWLKSQVRRFLPTSLKEVIWTLPITGR